jgi:hypothetical protein
MGQPDPASPCAAPTNEAGELGERHGKPRGKRDIKEHRFHAILPLLLNSTSGKPRWTHKKIGNATFQFKGSGPGY